MENRQVDFLFWRIVHYFIIEKEYRLIQMSEDQQEIWLENQSNRNAQMVRILRYDLDWGNWMKRDIQQIGVQAENIRRHFGKRDFQMLNLYVSMYPPVDDFEDTLKQPLELDKGRTRVHSILFASDRLSESTKRLSILMKDQLAFSLKENYEDIDIQMIKRTALSHAANQVQEERQLFEFGKPLFTYIFLFIQVVVYFSMTVAGGDTTQNLIRFGAKVNPLIIDGQWWRFFTPIFLHVSIIHLLMNSLALYYLGPTIEKIFGRSRFLWIYLFAGFTGSLASFLFSNSISAGASGAIFGCFGALLYLGAVYPKLFFRTMGRDVIVVIIINLVFGFTAGGIDNFGHIGGLAGGFLAAAIVHFPKKRKLSTQLAALVITGVITLWMLFIGYHGAANTL
ncbi:rhomboid family intramembrane serine protease [Heyndrickxia acidicola]|uniref:Rhomboid family intramembrane serine protease n=1 Tax=Heyndrickxia acidicola TaxID=209389 RepID=A0ABU6MKX1_9BACI|nr:rhomboid family intramembrane serine protease [Heyndrickxia acidicola]MED1205134.1 rhomboid family intramembrane serine protease [Heyndrickxia acidicola]